MDSASIYGLPAAISSFLYIILIFILLKKDKKSKLAILSALLFALLFIWSFAEWMLRWSHDHDSAFFWASMIFIPIILLSPVLIHLSLIFPWSNKEAHPGIYGMYALSLLLLGIHFNSRLFISDVHIYYAGYGTVIGPYGIFIYLYLAVSGLIFLLILMAKYSRTESKIALQQLKLLIIAFSISYMFIFFTGFVPYLYGNPDAYPWTTPSFLIMGFVLAYAMCRFHVFLPQPEYEAEGRGGKPCSGVKILPREEAMAEFYDRVNSGNRGLCITARDPEETKEEMDLKKVPVVGIDEISEEKTDLKGEHRRSFIPFILTDALMEKNTVMILDGFEQIFSNEEFKDFVETMSSLELKDSMLIISTNGKSGIYEKDNKKR